MVDQHTHCPCNGVLLCAKCHWWVHNHPLRGMEDGLIVARSRPDPGSQWLHGFDGWWRFDCLGQAHPLVIPQP